MKKILILVLSSDFPPYSEMIKVSKETWDSVRVDNCETIFYCSQKDNPNWKYWDGNVLYFDVNNSLYDMGHKNIAMFETALLNHDFDYVVRLNASHYCNKKELVKHIETLPNENVFQGLYVDDKPEPWLWGGGGFIISKDVIQKIVENKNLWDHSIMEDVAISKLVKGLGIPFTDGKSCSIDRLEGSWRCMSYGGPESFEFYTFNEINKSKGHFVYRVKQDQKRHMDHFVMRELFKYLQ